MAPPYDAAQEVINGANQAKTIMEVVTENIARLQQEIEALDNDRRNAQQETSTVQEEARSTREQLVSARQEIQRLDSQLDYEKASNRSLRQRLRDLGDDFASFQNAFRVGYEVFSTVYQRTQRLVFDTNDTTIDASEAAQTLAAQTAATASPTESPVTTSPVVGPSAPTSPVSSLSSPADAPTPSTSTESTLSTQATSSAVSVSATSPPAPDVAAASRRVATVDCYATVALENEDSGVPPATQSTVYSSLVTKSAQRFRMQQAWTTQDLSGSLKRSLDSWRHNCLNKVSQILLECAHSGTSEVIYEATNNEQIAGITIAATDLAFQMGESHEYMKLLAEQHEGGFVCPSVVIVTSSGELVSRIFNAFEALIKGNVNEGIAIRSIQVTKKSGEDGKSLAGFKTNLPTILVCTPGRLMDLIRQLKFSARLLHTLVVCQGSTLASAGFASEMQKIIAWARCMRPCLTGEQPVSTAAARSLTTIILSRSFERDSTLHQELQQRYLNEFIRTTDVTRAVLGKQLLLVFKGKIEVQTCAFNVVARSKHFVDKILPVHRGESILCMEFSRERAADFASQCRKLGVPGQVFTTESENSKTIQQFRNGQCKIMFTTPAGFEGLRYRNVKTAVIFASPYQSLYTDENGDPRPGVYNRRTDFLRAAIESVEEAGEEAMVYIFVGQGTAQPVKDDITEVMRQAGCEIPSVLKSRPRWW